ncbi:MAG: hypothetical protein ABSD59_17205 [Terracidiphilus sp.]
MKDENMRTSWFPTLLARSAKRMGHGFEVGRRLSLTLAGKAKTRRGWGTHIAVWLLAMGLSAMVWAQGVSTTTVQGTVYLANGQPGAGTLIISWPGFTTATGQAVAADQLTVTIPPDGFVSVNLAPNLGATPAGEYYTAVYYMSDGTVNTQYWVVPAAANATLAQVQAQLMPATQAVQAVSKTYVDEAITELSQSLLTATGGTVSGPLYLNADPTQPLQAATKHYVDTQVATSVPLAGGNMTGPLTTPAINGVESPTAASAQTTLQAAINAAGTNGAMEIPPNYAGTDTFTNPNGVKVVDFRTTGAQQTERSVKEFGAVCDGVTDDTVALQSALSYANAHGVSLTIPEGTCKTRSLAWHGESIGGLGKQVSALMGFPGQDVLGSGPDATNLLNYTRLHDFTIYVDQSLDVSCAPAEGRAAAGNCTVGRPMEGNSIFSPGANGLTNTVGTGAAWWVGNCAIAMQASTGAGGNGLKVAEIENVEIATTGVDPMAAQYPGAHSTHTCGLYLAQWPQWSDFRNIDIRGLNTGVAIPALPVTAPAGLTADSNRWQNVTIQAVHAFTAAAGSNNVLDNVVAMAGNSSAAGETPTGLVLDLSGNAYGWTVRNTVVIPTWNGVQPALTVTAAGGAVTAVSVGSQKGLGWDPYGTSAPVAFSGACTAQATATANASGSIAGVTVTQGGVGCSSTTTASINAPGTWDTAAPVNLIGGQDMTLLGGNLLKGNGGYSVWNATSSASYGTQVDGGGGALPGGGTYAALVRNSSMGSAFAVDQFPGTDIGAKIQACVNALNTSYGGTCDARNFTGNLSMASNLTIATPNTAILLPCATITTAKQIVVTAGTRNVSLRGCALRGGSAASGSQGGTVFAYSGTGAMVQVGDATYAVDTPGFHLDNVAINTTAATSASAQGLVAYRTQEIDFESLYFLGNQNQTGMTLDGTGNYTGGTFLDNQFTGFGTAMNAIGHQVANAATTDWLNASTFVRLHIDCPTSGGNPISGTYGINLQQGDGNTFTGGDVEGCATALHLGANAENNTIVGLRNENSTNQIVADTGSAYNSWMTGGAMYTGKLTDNGTRNSFLDTFHRSFNGLNGDWYGSQQDATLTNHLRLGIGNGNERGLLDEIQTDYGYRWTYGFNDGTTGQQAYQIQDLVNNVPRISVGQYLSATANVVTNVVVNNGGCYTSSTAPSLSFAGGGGSGATATANLIATTSSSCAGGYTVGSVTVTAGGSGYTSQPSLSFSGSNQTAAPNAVGEIATAGGTNNQTVINSAGTGAVVLNGSNGAGTGGVVFGSGGATETTVATVDKYGDASFNGTLLVAGTSQSTGTLTVRNNADAEVDYYLWPGLTASQKGSFTYKDWNGNSQWYMVKDQYNNWALNSAVGGLDSFKAYQSTNSGDTYIDASNTTGHIRLNYESGSGSETDIYAGSTTSLVAAFMGPTSIKFPGLAAVSGQFCLQVDSSGYITNTGSGCGTAAGPVSSGSINAGSTGQVAVYTTNGMILAGVTAVPLTAGGTGATSASGAMANLLPGVVSDGSNGIAVTGAVVANGGVGSGAGSCNSGTPYMRYDKTCGVGGIPGVTSFAAPSASWPSWLAPSISNPTTTPSLSVSPSTIPLTAGGTGATSASGAMANLLPGVASDGSNGIAVTGNVNAASYKVSGSPFGTANLADWTDSGIANGLCAVWNSTTSKWTPGGCGLYAGVTSPGTGGLVGDPSTTQTWEITPSGNAIVQQAITASSPVCDIRAYGAKIDNSTDIGPYIQDCVNQIYPWAGGVTWTVLLPCGATPCYWDNPSALTFPDGGPFRFELEGYLRLGSTLVASGNEDWYGIGPPGEGLQFQTGTPALITGPVVDGTLGTAITGEDAAVTITPTFTSGNIAHLPVGSAITIGETSAASATASRISYGGYGLVTLTLSGSPRFLPMETMNVSGCSDSSFNITGGAILKVDYSAAGGEQVTYGETASTTPGSATGCTITSFDEDKFESARVFCSNGVNLSGFSYSCGAGQITIITEHPHSSAAQWGAVAFSPQYADQAGHTVSDLDINGCYGMCYWGELESNLEMTNVGVSPAGGFLSAGGMEETGSWVGYVKQLHIANASLTLSTPLCGGGGCTQPSYPYGLRCDSESPAAGYGASATGCAAFTFDGGSAIGGIKIDGGGRRAITAFPYEIENMLFEQAPNAALTIDNRFAIDPSNCLSFNDNSLQDSITGMTTYALAYTNNESPSMGCYKLSDLGTALTPYYMNPYFNDAASIDRTPYGTTFAPFANNTASTGVYNDGVEMQAAARGSGAGFGPQVLPFGSLAIDNSPADWATDCTAAGCTAVTTNVSCPDGTQATSKMQCAELDGPGSPFNIGAWTGSTYAGDQFIYGCYIRPGANFSFPQGMQNQDAFMLYTRGTDTFAPNAYGGTSYTTPSFGFGTKLAHNTWYPLIAIATITSGESTSHTINFMITSGNGNGGSAAAGYGNQFSDCRWAFVPGPNNPAYAGVTQDEVAYARDNQYRGAVPASVSAGTAATGETISTNGYQVNGVALNAPSEIYNASANGGITLPSADRAEATYLLSGSVTASIGSGTGGGKVTIFICQPASGGPYTWTWPSNWKGGVTVGTVASTCSEQTGTYIAGFGDWHGDAGSTNVPK